MRPGSASLKRQQGRSLLALRAGTNIVVETVRISAGPYSLEGELAYSDEADGPRGGVVLAGSHPLLGGNMHNNVVRGVGDGLAEQGWSSVRFNYRGVGGSEGPRVDVAGHMAEFWATSHVAGEMDLWQDVQGASAFLRPIVGSERPLVLIGYSFGCALLPLVCRTESPAAVVAIAPPLSKHDYEDFTTIKSPLLAIVSENDFTTDAARLRDWFDRLPEPKRLMQGSRDNHFFRGHEPWLVETISVFLSEHVR
ncbi:MAG: alpha/beta hydrolase [Gemmataceae bacterium]